MSSVCGKKTTTGGKCQRTPKEGETHCYQHKEGRKVSPKRVAKKKEQLVSELLAFIINVSDKEENKEFKKSQENFLNYRTNTQLKLLEQLKEQMEGGKIKDSTKGNPTYKGFHLTESSIVFIRA